VPPDTQQEGFGAAPEETITVEIMAAVKPSKPTPKRKPVLTKRKVMHRDTLAFDRKKAPDVKIPDIYKQTHRRRQNITRDALGKIN
jgi:hypothetical protein